MSAFVSGSNVRRGRRFTTPQRWGAVENVTEGPGLDFHWAMTRLVGTLCQGIGAFRGYDINRIQVSASFNRSRSRSGLLAYVIPFKYRGGSPVEIRVRNGKAYHWAMLPEFDSGEEVLYRIYFMLPRFLNLPLRDKLETVIHELYHIHPHCNGDLRRFPGRSPLHGCHKEYDRTVARMTDEFLASCPDTSVFAFLRGNSQSLVRTYGELKATHHREPRPKLLKVTHLRDA